ncbi:MAG: T9SS type A sorting domain-containing protein [Elusimicrobiota bacterium]
MYYLKTVLYNIFNHRTAGIIIFLIIFSFPVFAKAGSPDPVDSIAAGGYHTLALKESGTLWAWGNNYYGELGIGASGGETDSFSEGIDEKHPVRVGSDTDWSKITAGARHSLGIKEDGTLWAWGWNDYGQLGLGDTIDKDIPLQVSTHSWSFVAGGGYHTLAIREDGTLWAWGRNEDGQLGVGDNSDKNSPVQVGVSTRWVTCAAGANHSLAIKDNGKLWAWGFNDSGRLGLEDNYTIGESTNIPVEMLSNVDWDKISAGFNHTLGIKDNNTLWAWGANTYGQLGGATAGGVPSQPELGTEWKNVSCGWDHTLGIQNDNSLHAWGRNNDGQLGLGYTNPKEEAPQEVSTDTWKLISAGGAGNDGTGGTHLDNFHSLAIREDNYRDLWGWGSNSYGQLGQEDTVNKDIPTRTYIITNYGIEVSSSVVAGDTFTMTVNAKDGDDNVSYFSGAVNIQAYLAGDITKIGSGQLSITDAELSDGVVVIDNQTYTAAEDIRLKVSDGIENTGLSSTVTVTSAKANNLNVKTEPEYVVPGQTATLTATVLDSYGNAVSNVATEFEITSGTGTLSKSSDNTDDLGRVVVGFYPGETSGNSFTSTVLTTGGEGEFSVAEKIHTGVEIDSKTGGTVKSTEKSLTRINIPAGAILKDVSFFIITEEDLTAGEQALVDNANSKAPSDKIIAPGVRKIKALDNDGGIYDAFEDFVEIEFSYDDTNNDGRVDGANILEEELKVLYLNPSTEVWEIITDGGINTVDGKENKVRAEVKKFSILTLGNPTQDSLDGVEVYPNPVNFSKAVRGTVKFQGLTRDSKIKIYDVTGRLVKTLKPGTSENDGESGKAEWDGKSENGKKVSMGLYIYSVTDPDGNQTSGKFGVVK